MTDWVLHPLSLSHGYAALVPLTGGLLVSVGLLAIYTRALDRTMDGLMTAAAILMLLLGVVWAIGRRPVRALTRVLLDGWRMRQP